MNLNNDDDTLIGNRIAWTAVRVKLRIGRGQTWISWFNPIIYLAGIANFRVLMANPGYVLLFGLIYSVVLYIIGWVDEVRGIWKKEAIYGTRELNPYFVEMYNNVKIIKDRYGGN